MQPLFSKMAFWISAKVLSNCSVQSVSPARVIPGIAAIDRVKAV